MIDKKLKEEWWDILNSNLLDRPLHMVMHTQEELFYEFLDRAYALGKVKEAITQEEIEKAAEKFATDVEGESVSVYPEEQRADIYPEYETSDLINAFEAGANFTLGKQEKDADTVIQGWVTRNGSGPYDLGLRIYTVKPDRMKNRREWNGHGEMSYLIDYRLFPDLTWDSEPEPVEIIIKRKKNG